MRFMRLAVAAAFLLGFSSAYAFHDGGVADCGGCHAVHKGDTSGTVTGASNTNLLASDTVSDTCFGCHASQDTTGSGYHVLSTTTGSYAVTQPPAERTPGGDFGWLLKSYTQNVRGTISTWSPGGHHINAPLFGITNATGMGSQALAPGGTFPTSSLGCSSCHDPHSKARTDSTGAFQPVNAWKIIGSGSYTSLYTPASGETNDGYGTYRFLYNQNSYYTGAGYAGPVPATIAGGQVTWTGLSPLAVVPSSYQQVESVNQLRVAYANIAGRTMGLWCAACHPKMHTNSGLLVHPIDAALNTGGENGYYNVYVNSGNKTGTAATAYLSLVPFAIDGATRSTLASTAGLTNGANAASAGANPTDTVMCLSCHRAHASGFQNDIRWENEVEFITYTNSANVAVWPGSDNQPSPTAGTYGKGRPSADTQAAYYDRNVTIFGAFQRSLCNKCHIQD